MSEETVPDNEDTISVPLPVATDIDDIAMNMADVGQALEAVGRVITVLKTEFDRLRILIEGEDGVISHGPPDPGTGLTPCCGRSVLDISMSERILFDGAAVTCTGPAKAPPQN